MKIAICGKGGCGKSTLTTMLAKQYASEGKKVFIIDSDESNFGLHRLLGVPLPEDFDDYLGGKQQVLGKMMSTMASGETQFNFFDKEVWTTDEIPEKFISEKDGIKLLASGKIQDSNEGCACAFGNVIAEFVSKLQLKDDEILLMDMEAGVEHFGRGIDNFVDEVVMMVDPSYESLALSEKVGHLCSEINKPLYFVLNRVTETSEPVMRKNINAEPEQILAALPEDEEVLQSGLMGETLDKVLPQIADCAKKLA